MLKRITLLSLGLLLCAVTFNSPSSVASNSADDFYSVVVDKIVMHKTPQSGTWLFCFKLKEAADNEATFHLPNKEYEKDGIEIPTNLKLADIKRGSQITWWMGLDDDEADACSGQAEDRAEGKFTARLSGSPSFNPRDNWSFTMYYHLVKE